MFDNYLIQSFPILISNREGQVDFNFEISTGIQQIKGFGFSLPFTDRDENLSVRGATFTLDIANQQIISNLGDGSGVEVELFTHNKYVPLPNNYFPIDLEDVANEHIKGRVKDVGGVSDSDFKPYELRLYIFGTNG